MKEYFVVSEADLDDLDSDEILADVGSEFIVTVLTTGNKYKPSWCIRSNGDIDGLEGWNYA